MSNNMTVVQGDKYQMMSEGKIHRLQVCEIRPRDQGEYRIIAKDKDAKAKLELAGKSAAHEFGFRKVRSDVNKYIEEHLFCWTKVGLTNSLT